MSISNRKEQERHDSIYAAAGVCLAKVHLYDQWDSVGGDPLSVGQSEVSVWQSDSTSNGQLVGAVIEFTITAEDDVTLSLRSTVASGTGAPGNWNQTPAFDPGAHVRGWWPFSKLIMPAGEIDVKPPQPGANIVFIQVCAAGGPEFTAFEQTSGDTFGTSRGNRGCYGANLFYDFNVTNTDTQNLPLHVYAQSRNNGGSSLGATRIQEPTTYGAYGFSGMICSGGAPAAGKWLRLTTSDGANEVPAIIAPSATPTYRIAVAIGGAGATPYNLVLSTLGIELTAESEN